MKLTKEQMGMFKGHQPKLHGPKGCAWCGGMPAATLMSQ